MARDNKSLPTTSTPPRQITASDDWDQHDLEVSYEPSADSQRVAVFDPHPTRLATCWIELDSHLLIPLEEIV